jgi:hypothetical protein
MAGVPAEIRTEHPPNTSLGRYRHNNLLGKKSCCLIMATVEVKKEDTCTGKKRVLKTIEIYFNALNTYDKWTEVPKLLQHVYNT